MEIANNYIQEYGKIVGKSNSIIIPNNADDISGVLAKGLTIMESF